MRKVEIKIIRINERFLREPQGNSGAWNPFKKICFQNILQSILLQNSRFIRIFFKVLPTLVLPSCIFGTF